MMSKSMPVLVVEPEKAPYAKEIGTGLESLQKAVGGDIEGVYPFTEPVAIVCDGEAKLTGKPLNRALRDEDGHIYDVVAGTFLVVGLGDGEFASLDDKLMKQFSNHFKTPETFLRMNGKLVVLPMELPKEKPASVLSKLNTPVKQKPSQPKKPKSKEMER